MKLTDINFSDVQKTTVHERTIDVLLANHSHLEFNYQTKKELQHDLALWLGDRTASQIALLPPFDFRPTDGLN